MKAAIGLCVALGLGALAAPAMGQVEFRVEVGPPPAVVYAPPPRVDYIPAPRAGYVWVPGHWVWNQSHYVWAEGYWAVAQPAVQYWSPPRVHPHWHPYRREWREPPRVMPERPGVRERPGIPERDRRR